MRTKTHQIIRRAGLARSREACHRIEDAQWGMLRGFGVSEQSRPGAVRQALADVRRNCPAWCEQEAWDRMAEVVERWAEMFGSLQTFWQLRRKRDQE